MRFNKQRQLLSSLALVVLALLLQPALSSADTSAPTGWPSWRATTAEGKEFRSQELDGKVVVVAMWASWCPNCRKQLPILNTLQQFYGRDELQVLSFSFDHTEEDHRKFVEDEGLDFPSIFAREGEGLKVVKMLQQKSGGTLEAVPTVLVYDKRGHLAHRITGFFNRKQLDDMIQPLLSEE